MLRNDGRKFIGRSSPSLSSAGEQALTMEQTGRLGTGWMARARAGIILAQVFLVEHEDYFPRTCLVEEQLFRRLSPSARASILISPCLVCSFHSYPYISYNHVAFVYNLLQIYISPSARTRGSKVAS